jgi:hypothetical protein
MGDGESKGAERPEIPEGEWWTGNRRLIRTLSTVHCQLSTSHERSTSSHRLPTLPPFTQN